MKIPNLEKKIIVLKDKIKKQVTVKLNVGKISTILDHPACTKLKTFTQMLSGFFPGRHATDSSLRLRKPLHSAFMVSSWYPARLDQPQGSISSYRAGISRRKEIFNTQKQILIYSSHAQKQNFWYDCTCLHFLLCSEQVPGVCSMDSLRQLCWPSTEGWIPPNGWIFPEVLASFCSSWRASLPFIRGKLDRVAKAPEKSVRIILLSRCAQHFKHIHSISVAEIGMLFRFFFSSLYFLYFSVGYCLYCVNKRTNIFESFILPPLFINLNTRKRDYD